MPPPLSDAAYDPFAPCLVPGPELEATVSRRADTLLALLSPRPGLRLLDLGGGPPHHALELGRRGPAVSWIAPGARWPDLARRWPRVSGVGVERIDADPLSFDDRPGSFDAVLHLGGWFASLGPEDDAHHLLATAHRALDHDGLLILEVFSREALLRQGLGGHSLGGHGPGRHGPRHGHGRYWIEEWRVDNAWHRAQVSWTLFEGGEPRQVRRSLRIHDRHRIEALLGGAGFEAISWPDLPWPAERRIVGELVLARKMD